MNKICNSLSDFITKLEQEDELIRIKKRVSPILEITEITDRISKSRDGGKALLFENVEGSNMPVLINAYGSKKRINIALGTENIEEIPSRITELINMKPPTNFYEKIEVLKILMGISKFPPKTIKANAPCQEVVFTGDEIDLYTLPILKCWPNDGGRFITLPVVITRGLHDKKRNVGLYRMQVFDKKMTGMHWHIHKDAASQFDEYKKEGKRMEVAVAIGTDPVVTYAATAPLPPGLDELLLAGFIRKKGVELVKCKTIDLEVPALAEIILEGYIDPKELKTEGPFGDHTGYYSLIGEYPVFHITAITQRKSPVYFTTIVGKPPMEDCYLGKATERIFLPLLKTVNPEIEDMSLPWEGVFHNCVIVSLKKRYPGHAIKLMSSLWGAGQMSFAKMILAVDAGIDVHNHKEIARLLLNNIDLPRDIIISEGVLDVLDHSAPNPLFGGKTGIDLTTPITGEPVRLAPNKKSGTGENLTLGDLQTVSDSVTGFFLPFDDVNNPLLFLSIDKKMAYQVQDISKKLWKSEKLSDIKIIAIYDKNVDVSNCSSALWRLFNNVDPRRDFIFNNGRLIIDATKKLKEEGYNREWPDDIVMTQEIVDRVDSKWEEIFGNAK
jgi:4-hydroxy-3-polyprenylbenzoate decarboxylase